MLRTFVTNGMPKEWMLRRKVGPVFINYLQHLLVKTIQVCCPLIEIVTLATNKVLPFYSEDCSMHPCRFHFQDPKTWLPWTKVQD